MRARWRWPHSPINSPRSRRRPARPRRRASRPHRSAYNPNSITRCSAPACPRMRAALFSTGAPTAQAIWTQAIAQNVIPSALSAAVPQAVTAFQTLAGANRLTAAPKFGLSRLQDLVAPTLTGPGQGAAILRALDATRRGLDEFLVGCRPGVRRGDAAKAATDRPALLPDRRQCPLDRRAHGPRATRHHRTDRPGNARILGRQEMGAADRFVGPAGHRRRDRGGKGDELRAGSGRACPVGVPHRLARRTDQCRQHPSLG